MTPEIFMGNIRWKGERKRQQGAVVVSPWSQMFQPLFSFFWNMEIAYPCQHSPPQDNTHIERGSIVKRNFAGVCIWTLPLTCWGGRIDHMSCVHACPSKKGELERLRLTCINIHAYRPRCTSRGGVRHDPPTPGYSQMHFWMHNCQIPLRTNG